MNADKKNQRTQQSAVPDFSVCSLLYYCLSLIRVYLRSSAVSLFSSLGKETLMCLGIPGKVVETYREHDVLMAKVDFSGVSKRVCLEHVPEAQPGDYVLVHVGFALSRIDEEEARRVFEFLEKMNQLDELEAPSS
jgi:hydrogenase expression/formation protein HypC